MAEYKKLEDDVLCVTTVLDGASKLRRIFNFTARQVATIYDQIIVREYTIPKGSDYGSNSTGKSAACSSAMTVHNFGDLENEDELAAMHAKLTELKGNPPPLTTKTIKKGL